MSAPSSSSSENSSEPVTPQLAREETTQRVYSSLLIVKTTTIGEEFVVPTDERKLLVSDLKEDIGEHLKIPAAEQRLVFRGKVLQDSRQLCDYGISDGSVIFMARQTAVGSVGGTAAMSAERLATDDTSSQSSSSRPESIRPPSASMNFFINTIANNPDMAMRMLEADPRTKRMMERNPQLRHALSDPETLKQVFSASANPNLQKEMLRGQERALANIELMPGGFQALRELYTQEVESADGLETDLKRWRQSPDLQSTLESHQKRTVDPVPNPWAKPQKSARSASGTTRNILQSSNWTTDLFEQLKDDPLPPSNRPSVPPPLSASPRGGSESTRRMIDDPYSSLLTAPLNDVLLGTAGRIGDQSFDTTLYEERFKTQLTTMRDMGFDDTRENVKALLSTGGNVNLAIDLLLGRQRGSSGA